MANQTATQTMSVGIHELDEEEQHRAKFFRRNGIPFRIVNGRVLRAKESNRVIQYSLSYDIRL